MLRLGLTAAIGYTVTKLPGILKEFCPAVLEAIVARRTCIRSTSWLLGSINMSASLIFQAITAHSSKFDDKQRMAMSWGTTVHQVASVGFYLLSLNKSESELGVFWNAFNLSLLSVATFLFPGVTYL